MRLLLSIFLCMLMLSCGSRHHSSEDVIIRYGDKELTRQEIIGLIPAGLSPADSAMLFESLADSWIRDQVLSEFAEERLYDLEKINHKARDYRNDLIVLEYLKRMRETQTPKIEQSKVKEYYETHRKELKLEAPLMKGIFIKINSDTPGREEIKRLLSSDSPENIDELERKWLEKSLEYNYFRDKWIDWETLKGMIPYRFGDADKFLEENSYFETEYDDCAYYLRVTDWLSSGQEQPFEFAKTWITDVLTQGELAEYERVLVNSLIEKAVEEHKLELIDWEL